jgi:NAD(P)-dependent dehydrogenase (short-subunit alcohol dehydrogenase family)
VVTGAGRGLGRAIARRLAQAGLQVVAVDRLEFDGDYLDGLGEGHETLLGDVSAPETIDQACSRAAELGDGLATVVLNAGVHSSGPSVDLAIEEWDRMLEVNLSAVFVGARTARRYLSAGSSLVMLSSISAARGFAERAAYCASKAGVEGLVRALAMEWGPDGVRVNAVAPGSLETDMFRAASASGAVSLGQYLDRIPMQRVGQPEEIADAVAYLASERASYISGVVLPVDGGWAGGGLPVHA